MKTSNVFTTPSFQRGIARVLDLQGKLSQYPLYAESDTEALEQDWNEVGKDLQIALIQYEKESRAKK